MALSSILVYNVLSFQNIVKVSKAIHACTFKSRLLPNWGTARSAIKWWAAVPLRFSTTHSLMFVAMCRLVAAFYSAPKQYEKHKASVCNWNISCSLRIINYAKLPYPQQKCRHEERKKNLPVPKIFYNFRYWDVLLLSNFTNNSHNSKWWLLIWVNYWAFHII